MENMKVDREYFYELVDKIPESKLLELRMILLKMAIPEVEPTPVERKILEEAREDEFITYASFEELEKDIMGD